MAQATFQVASYLYYSWSSRTSGNTNLILHGPAGKSCTVWFVEDPAAPLPPAKEDGPGRYSFYYHHSQLPHLIDMVRNEAPITVFFNNDGGANNSRISTSDEPAGEGELA
jgi:hypothetical protein